MKSLQPIYINRENAILTIVDMQNEFCKPGGKRYGETMARILPGVVSAINRLAEQARRVGVPVIYVQSVRTLKEPEVTVFGKEPILEIGTWASEIIEELKPHQGDIVVQKFSHDPFLKPDLDQVLQKLVPEPTKYYAIVTGGAVNVCHYHAVMGFYLRDYWTVVPVDSVYYLSDDNNQRALEQFSGFPYPSIFLSRSDLVEISDDPTVVRPTPIPGK